MKNKKGFTLVELLVVIGILGVLIAIAVPSAIGISNRIKAKMYDSKVKTIEVAAGLWAEDHKSDCIENYGSLSVQDLIAGGYLKADENGQVTNPNPTSDADKFLNQKTVLSLGITYASVCSNQIKPGAVAAGKILEDNIKEDSTGKSTGPFQTESPDNLEEKDGYPNEDDNDASKSGLYVAEDDDGTSYYFRGAVTNNNVRFAGKKWKILRINGDGSIRLVYNDENGPGKSAYNDNDVESFGYTKNNDHACTKANPCTSNYVDGAFKFNYGTNAKDSIIKEVLEKWYLNNLTKDDDKIALATYCNDTSIFKRFPIDEDLGFSDTIYFGKDRKNIIDDPSSSLKCPDPTEYQSEETHNYGGVYKLKIGLLTYAEMKKAGLGSMKDGVYGSPASSDNYLYYITNNYTWSMTPNGFVHCNEYDYYKSVYYANQGVIAWNYDEMPYEYISMKANYNVVPVINLKAGVTLEGTGTEEDPYVVVD